MKGKLIVVIAVSLLVLAGAGWWYWQGGGKWQKVRKVIERRVEKKSEEPVDLETSVSELDEELGRLDEELVWEEEPAVEWEVVVEE